MAPSVDIHYMPESPPCRVVAMVASLINVKLNKHYINLFKRDHLKEDYMQINPRRKIPLMIDGDLKINESRSIIAYLVNKYSPDNSLYPNDPVQRARIDELLYYDIGTLFPAASNLLRSRLFGDVNAALDPEKEKAFKDSLNYLEKRLADGSDGKLYMLGNDLTVADIALSATLSFASLGCGYGIDSFPGLLSYMERIRAAIPDYAEINDEANANTRKFIQGRREACET